MTNCPVCNTQNVRFQGEDPLNTRGLWDCPRCGEFYGSSAFDWGYEFTSEKERALVSHYIRKAQDSIQKKKENIPVITSAKIEEIIKDNFLPDVAEQINLVIKYIGKKSEFLGQRLEFTPNELLALQAFCGCVKDKSLGVLLTELKNYEFISEHSNSRYALTVKGWQKYEEIKKGKTDSKNAFMAMQFSDDPKDVLEGIVKDHFKPAVEQTGFNLLKLDDKPMAGLIDIRMRQEIKNCKFVIADLTHANLGAYWEAGFAEGVGKTVIYTCEKSVFEEKKTHFDVNHHLTIKWDAENPAEAVESLKAAIRYTFREDAIQEDKR